MADKVPPNNTRNSTSQPMAQRLNQMAVSSQILQKFTDVNSEYKPQSQTTPSTNVSPSALNEKNTSQTSGPEKQLSVFAQSAYETAEYNTIRSLQAQTVELDKFQGLKFIVLDGLISELNDHYDTVAGTFLWEYLQDNEELCISFIRDKCINARVFIIVSGRLGQQIVPKINEFPQVYCIYVYCGDIVAHRKWATKYPKVRVVCNDDKKDLIPKFAVDVAQANIDWGNALFKAGKKTEAKEKFNKALKNLTDHAERPDLNMVETVKRSIEACK